MNNNIFEKPPFSIEEQIKLLVSRGMIIKNQELAAHYLKFIGYHRFCNYANDYRTLTLDRNLKTYASGTTFEEVLNSYVFDRKLRLLMTDALERIEIGVRTTITNELALKYGAHWYLDSSLFLENFKHRDFIMSIEKSTGYLAKTAAAQYYKKEQVFQKYFTQYTAPHLPPIWAVAEIISFGTWSMLFAKLKHRADQKIICKHVGINYRIMTSWLHSLAYLRNLCAHHSKLWSRNFTLKPSVDMKYFAQLKNNVTFMAQAALIKIFLDIVAIDHNWCFSLSELLNAYPDIKIEKMGFGVNWYNDPFWNINSEPKK